MQDSASCALCTQLGEPGPEQDMAAKTRKRQPPLEVDFNGTPRQVKDSSSSSSSTSGNESPQPEQQQQQQQHHQHHRRERVQHISAQEWGSMALLVLLYAMQGIPLGLTLGAMWVACLAASVLLSRLHVCQPKPYMTLQLLGC